MNLFIYSFEEIYVLYLLKLKYGHASNKIQKREAENNNIWIFALILFLIILIFPLKKIIKKIHSSNDFKRGNFSFSQKGKKKSIKKSLVYLKKKKKWNNKLIHLLFERKIVSYL